MILDDVIPQPDHSLTVHVVVDAPPHQVWRAIREANLFSDPLVRWLVGARDLPRYVWNRVRRRAAALPQPSITFEDIVELDEWMVLGEETEREVVLGSVGRFWQRDYGWVAVEPSEFASFDEPGFAKTVAGLSLRPYGTRTLLSYESRTVGTSADARRKFGRYWFVLRLFVGMVMRRAVSAIRAEAERDPRIVVEGARAPTP